MGCDGVGMVSGGERRPPAAETIGNWQKYCWRKNGSNGWMATAAGMAARGNGKSKTNKAKQQQSKQQRQIATAAAMLLAGAAKMVGQIAS